MKLATLAPCAKVPPGEGRQFDCQGRQVAAFNVGGSFHALAGECPHRGGPLGEGPLEGAVVICPWHGWRFDVTTGQNPDMPAARVPTLRTQVSGDDLQVEID